MPPVGPSCGQLRSFRTASLVVFKKRSSYFFSHAKTQDGFDPPIEQDILESIVELNAANSDAYGFSIARRMADAAGGKALIDPGMTVATRKLGDVVAGREHHPVSEYLEG